MTTQYAILLGVSGQTGLTAKLFASEESDTVLYASDSMLERTNALGQYRFTFGELAVIPAGDYFAISTTGAGVVVSMGWRTFAGTDGETATTTVPTAVLDSAATAALVDLIWDEPLTGATHNVATSSGKRLRQTTAFQQIDSTVVDASATTTTFVTGLTSAVDNFYNDSMLVFTDGALAGQVRAIYDYIGATKTIILEEALTSAPVNGVAFAIVSLHIHPVSQIQSGLATAASIVTLRGADSDTLKTLSDQIDTVSTNVSSIASVSREAF
jgi:hypothetical protein